MRMENNTGVVRKTALEKASVSATSQKTMGSGMLPHQDAEEALSHQAREIATRS